jgi:hypothetical protein
MCDKGRVIRLREEPGHEGNDDTVYLLADLIADRLLGWVPLVVRGTSVHTLEPAPQCVGALIAQPEHVTETQHRDGLEIRGHQVDVAPTGDLVSGGVRQRPHQSLDERVDLAGSELGVETAT